MAVAFWASSCTFCTSAFCSSGLSAPARTSLVGPGPQGPSAVPPRAAPQHPDPSSCSPLALTCSQRQDGRAGEQEQQGHLHGWGESRAQDVGQHGGPEPVPFPARPSPGMSPLTCAGLCEAGAALGSLFIPSPRAPLGDLCKGQGRPGGGCRGAVSSQELGNGAGTEPAGPRVSVSAHIAVHSCSQLAVHACAPGPVPAAGDSPGHTRHKGDIQRPCPRARRPRAPRGASDLATAGLVPALPAAPFARCDTPRWVGGCHPPRCAPRARCPRAGTRAGPGSIPRHRVAAVPGRVLPPPAPGAWSGKEGCHPACVQPRVPPSSIRVSP